MARDEKSTVRDERVWFLSGGEESETRAGARFLTKESSG